MPEHQITGLPVNFERLCLTCRFSSRVSKDGIFSCQHAPRYRHETREVMRSFPACALWEPKGNVVEM